MASKPDMADLRRRLADLKQDLETATREKRHADHGDVAEAFAAVFGLMDELAAAIEDLQG